MLMRHPESSTHSKDDFLDPIVEIILNDLREDQQKSVDGRPPPSSIKEIAAFIAQSSKESFADTINAKSAAEKKLFHSLKGEMEKKLGESNSHETEANRTDVSKYDQESEDWSSISWTAVLLHEVKDICEELTILQSLLSQQSSVLKDLVGPESSQNGDGRGPAFLLKEIKEMCEIIDTIQSRLVNEILNLEQNGISIIEAVLARNQADESARQGKTLMVFTIMAIVFTPMSFLSSPFALNVSSFQHDDGGNLLYKPGNLLLIGIFIVCVSIAITISLLIVTIYVEDLRKLIKTG
ncbi:hypothetical protein BDV06DRAFT_223700 [Aspergillus oleicola]